MKILSLDIGWRHLGSAQIDIDNGSFSNDSIHKWEILDLIEDENVNVNKTSIEELVTLSAKSLAGLDRKSVV